MAQQQKRSQIDVNNGRIEQIISRSGVFQICFSSEDAGTYFFTTGQIYYGMGNPINIGNNASQSEKLEAAKAFQSFIDSPIPFLTEGKYYWVMYTLVNMWKGIGWSAIIYISAMSGIDETLIEAGAVDGITRSGIVKHVVLPTILPTIVVLWIMGVGGILNAGFEQHLVLGNSATQAYWDVIDTYSYRYGIQLGYYSVGTAVGLMKSVIGVILVWASNWFCRKKLDTSIF